MHHSQSRFLLCDAMHSANYHHHLPRRHVSPLRVSAKATSWAIAQCLTPGVGKVKVVISNNLEAQARRKTENWTIHYSVKFSFRLCIEPATIQWRNWPQIGGRRRFFTIWAQSCESANQCNVCLWAKTGDKLWRLSPVVAARRRFNGGRWKCRTRHCRTGQWRTNWQSLTLQDRTTTDKRSTIPA